MCIHVHPFLNVYKVTVLEKIMVWKSIHPLGDEAHTI